VTPDAAPWLSGARGREYPEHRMKTYAKRTGFRAWMQMGPHRCLPMPNETKDVAFTGPVASDENRAAHGGICRIEYCCCGATRRTNINGSHVEQGDWTR